MNIVLSACHNTHQTLKYYNFLTLAVVTFKPLIMYFIKKPYDMIADITKQQKYLKKKQRVYKKPITYIQTSTQLCRWKLHVVAL